METVLVFSVSQRQDSQLESGPNKTQWQAQVGLALFLSTGFEMAKGGNVAKPLQRLHSLEEQKPRVSQSRLGSHFGRMTVCVSGQVTATLKTLAFLSVKCRCWL